MVEDANEGMHRRRLAGVDLAADQVERPLEPGDLQEREVVGGIGVAALELLRGRSAAPGGRSNAPPRRWRGPTARQ